MIRDCPSVDTFKASCTGVDMVYLKGMRRKVTTLSDGGLHEVYYHNSINGGPRISWYPHDKRVVVEVGLPRFFAGGNGRSLNPDETEHAFIDLDDWLDQYGAFPSIKDWKCSRIDFAMNWLSGTRTKDYLRALKKLQLGTYQRHIYPHGVQWSNKNRVVKFYNKARQSGVLDDSYAQLRMEVTTRGGLLKYMAEHWFECGDTVGEVSRYCNGCILIGRYLSDLGVDRVVVGAAQINRFMDHFGTRWAQALSYRGLIMEMGVEAHKQGHISRSTYYSYLNELKKAGLLTRSTVELPALKVGGCCDETLSK